MRLPQYTDETSESTEQTKINLCPYLFAMLGNVKQINMEENTHARNQNNGACQAVQKFDCCG